MKNCTSLALRAWKYEEFKQIQSQDNTDMCPAFTAFILEENNDFSDMK
jgi:hypothetical protein